MDEVWAAAGAVACEVLSEAPDALPLRARAIFHWRVRHLGRAVAGRDLERARAGGWADKVFDAEGRPLPPPSPEELDHWIAAEMTAAKLTHLAT